MTTNEELIKKLDEDWQDLQEFLCVPENDYDDEEQSRCLKTINSALKAVRDLIPKGIESAPFGESGKPETYIMLSKQEQGTTLVCTGYKNKHGCYEWWGGGMQGLTHWTPTPDKILEKLRGDV